ncbi:MAG: S9 family peptidase [Idiomarina sp.]|nr:S9 family peptidase [Idiomarina sp.]
MTARTISVMALSLLFVVSCAIIPHSWMSPPIAEQRPHVVTSPHGDREDPYHWLRDDTRTDPEVIAYLEAENAYYQAYADQYRGKLDELTDEIIGRVQQDDSSVPYVMGDYEYSTRFETGKEYPIYIRRPIAGGTEEVMLDVNELAEGHDYFAVANWEVSPSQNRLAYLVDTTGRRQYTLRIRDLTTGEDLPNELVGLSSSLAWSADSDYLYVIENDPVTLLSVRAMRHAVGGAPDNKALVYEEHDNTFYMGLDNTRDGKYVMIIVVSTVASEYRIIDASTPLAEPKVFAARERDVQYFLDHMDGRWIIRTDWMAPNFRLMMVDSDQIGSRAYWRELVPHNEFVFIDGMIAFESHLAIQERSNGLLRIRLVSWSNPADSRYISSDEAAYVMRFSVNYDTSSEWLRYSYTSLTTPQTIYEVNLATDERRMLKQDEVLGGFDSDNYVTERVWAEARDGTKIPVTLLYRNGFERDGTAPLYQYAYGSYGINMDPWFNSNILSLIDRGFVYAIAHIRGGQEMGRHWYEEGKLLNKMNTFTDYIDVTDHLVAEGYAAPDLVIGMGGSAGGLLMGAVANMAPEKYLGLIAHVPFVDVVSTMLDDTLPLTTNEYDEWGNPNYAEYYEYMLSYSPYDQVTRQSYPALYVTTGFHDSQVQYFEPAKWVAKLRTHNTSNQPILFNTTMEAGHGGRSGRFARRAQIAEEYALVLHWVERQKASRR